MSELNAAVEFHDSTLVAVFREGDRVIAELDAYLHRSAGRPGVDVGAGCRATVRLLVAGGEIQGSTGALPLDLWGGSVEAGGEVLSNLLPIPTTFAVPVRVLLRGVSGYEITLLGNELEAKLVSEAVCVDEFPGRV